VKRSEASHGVRDHGVVKVVARGDGLKKNATITEYTMKKTG